MLAFNRGNVQKPHGFTKDNKLISCRSFRCDVILELCDVQTVLNIVLCMLLCRICTAYQLLTKEGVDGSISVFVLHLLLPRLLGLLADVDGQPGTHHPEKNTGTVKQHVHKRV